MGRPLLVFCLDGGDLTHFRAHGGPRRFPMLGFALSFVRDLESTLVPQTPVAWSTVLAGAESRDTGIWGWWRVGRRALEPWAFTPLPRAVYDWGRVRVLLAGIPLLGEGRGTWGRSLQGIGGPGLPPRGSRPSVVTRDPDEAFSAWETHHRHWIGRIMGEQDAEQGFDLVMVHCDAVDWFSHRHGPASRGGLLGWLLAEKLLAELVERLVPRDIIVLSDHGSAEVRGVIRIHDALHGAGLLRAPGRDFAVTDDLLREPTFCVSDYGAIWSSVENLDAIERVLREMGARSVHVLPDRKEGAPVMAPVFDDGWLVLVPTPLYQRFGAGLGPRVRAEDVREDLQSCNWVGDHGRNGLLGTSSEALWLRIEACSLASIKKQLLGYFGEKGGP